MTPDGESRWVREDHDYRGPGYHLNLEDGEGSELSIGRRYL
jgi:hypothetical protein